MDFSLTINKNGVGSFLYITNYFYAFPLTLRSSRPSKSYAFTFEQQSNPLPLYEQ